MVAEVGLGHKKELVNLCIFMYVCILSVFIYFVSVPADFGMQFCLVVLFLGLGSFDLTNRCSEQFC